MNRRGKIIISVTGIFIVLLILVGLTYAYFLTQIRGNENDKSISVTTANLELVYGDGINEVITAEKILPGTTIGEKDFTVTNKGDATSYVVVIENVSVTYAETIGNVVAGSETTFNSPTDFVYTLTCTKSDGTSCEGVSETTLPMSDSIIVGNNIDVGDVHTYVLTVTYKETGVDQSADMNKKLEARVNITDVAQMENPFKTGITATDNASLAYNIIENAKTNKNGTTLLNVADTTVAEDIARYKENVTATESHGFYGWDGLTYGATAEEANNSETEVSGDTDLAKCESVKEQYISDSYNCYNDCSLIGKVVDCESDGTPVIYGYADKYESSLAVEQDDLGTSYYYRGAVEDNYVNFAGMCWRIVRIAGDGSTKLILEDQYTTCDDAETEATSAVYTGNWVIGSGNYGYDLSSKSTSGSRLYKMSYLKPVTSADKSMVKAFYDFQTTKLADYTGKLKSGNWCLADKTYTQSGSSGSYTYTLLEDTSSNYLSKTLFYYDAYTRLTSENADGYQPTLKCNGTALDKFESVTYNETEIIEEAPMYVSAITADEIAYAGGKHETSYYNYYLMNDYSKDSYCFWSLSPYIFSGSYDFVFDVDSNGGLNPRSIYHECGFRPSVTLASSVSVISGDGTIENPYTIG